MGSGALRQGHPLRKLFKHIFLLDLSLFTSQQNVETKGLPPLEILGMKVGKIKDRMCQQAKGTHSLLSLPLCLSGDCLQVGSPFPIPCLHLLCF